MYEPDREAFAKLITDVCVSVNRPCTPDLLRVLWEDLQNVPFAHVERAAKIVRVSGKKNFSSNDLRPPPEERAALGGPDNHALLDQLTRAMNRLWDRLTPNQQALAQFHEFVWTRDRIAPRPVALIIKADGDSPGHRITLADCALDDAFERVPPRAGDRARDDFDEAAAARELLNRAGTPDLLQR